MNAVQKKAIVLYEAGYGSTTIGHKLNVHQRIIREWILRYKLRGENGFVKLKPRSISVEEKIGIIKLLKEKSLSCEVVAITYGYSKSSVLSWLRIVDSEGYDGLYIRKKRESMKKIKKKANIAEDELKELYIKLEWLEAENALLKKVKALVEAEEARKRVNGRKPSKN
jgi:transposase